jgi:hypothetical protein
MHRAAFHFIKALGVPSWVTGKRKHSQKGAEEDDNASDIYGDKEVDDIESNIDEEDIDIDGNIGDKEVDDADLATSMDVEASASDVEAMAETLVVDFEPGDTLGKLLAFVNQVRMSSEDVRSYIAHSCCVHNIKPIELRLWVRSRWGSLSHCLSATLEVQKVRCI